MVYFQRVIHLLRHCVKDRLEYYRGDDPDKPRYAWYTDSEKLMAGIGDTGKVDIRKTSCKRSQPGAMVRGRNAMRRALLEGSESSSSTMVEEMEEDIEQIEAKVDVAEATLEALEAREEERKEARAPAVNK